jgi:Bacterial DNA-binding protein
MATKAATATTITLKHLAAAIAEEQELSKKQAETILTDLVTMITKHLKKGERIRIVGLGILQVSKRAAHRPQPSHGRGHPDQGEQEGGFPRHQGIEGSRLIEVGLTFWFFDQIASFR